MPANTKNGLPYPVETDPVADGNEAIQNLATALRFTSGSLAIPTGASPLTIAITYPAGLFTAAPVVVANTSSAYLTASTMTGGSTSGSSIQVAYRAASGAMGDNPSSTQQLRWIASQV